MLHDSTLHAKPTTMDYKYIEQLLERYWEGATTLEEEQILHAFFCQDELPEQLQCYAPLFNMQHQERAVAAPEALEQRIMDAIANEMRGEQPTASVKIRTVGFRRRLTPFFHAAASIALLVMAGLAVEHASTPHIQTPGNGSSIVAGTYVKTDDVANVIQQSQQPQTDVVTAQADSLVVPTLPVLEDTDAEP